MREQISNNIRQRLRIQRSPVCSLFVAPFSLSLVSVWFHCFLESVKSLPDLVSLPFCHKLVFMLLRKKMFWPSQLNGESEAETVLVKILHYIWKFFLMTHTSMFSFHFGLNVKILFMTFFSLWRSDVHLVTVSAHALSMSVVWDEFGVTNTCWSCDKEFGLRTWQKIKLKPNCLSDELQSSCVLNGRVFFQQQSLQAPVWVFVTVRRFSRPTGNLQQEVHSASSNCSVVVVVVVVVLQHHQRFWRTIQTSAPSVSCCWKTGKWTGSSDKPGNCQTVWH